jgi:hypothetical protein
MANCGSDISRARLVAHRLHAVVRLGCAPSQDYAVPLRLSLRRGNRLRFQGFYELVRA